MNAKVRIGIVAVVCVLLAATLSAAVAMADVGARVTLDAAPAAVPTLLDTLGMLAQGIGVGAVIAFLFEKIGWFQNMAPNVKWWVVLGMSLGLPLLARVALQFIPPDIWAKVEPYWISLATGFLIWAGSQAFHLYSRRAS